MRKKKKLPLHQRIHHHLHKHFHRHVHKVLHFTNHMHHHLFHNLELIVVTLVTLTSFGFANLTGLNQDLYRNNATETAEHLLTAIQNPAASLKQGNIISIRSMDMDVENTFAKGYCTYGAARVSPEFFPFIDEKTQQRTWGGNAVDRCKNASDTGYKIGMVPVQGALIIYDAGGRFGSYGHVGKVMHYDKSIKKIIVRDMARVARGSMSDRREDLTTAQVKCYIYNSKTDIPVSDTIIPTVDTGTLPTIPTTPVVTSTQPTTPVVVPVKPITPVVTPTQPIIPVVVPVKPITPIVNPTPIQPTTPVVVPVKPITPIVTPIQPITTPENNHQESSDSSSVIISSINKKIELKLENLSDIAQHFLTQYDITFTLVSKSPLKLGEAGTLTLEIKDKNGQPVSGLLPFSFSFLSTNDNIEADISNLQLITDGSADIYIVAQKAGTSTIIINMDDVKIGSFTLEAK